MQTAGADRVAEPVENAVRAGACNDSVDCEAANFEVEVRQRPSEHLREAEIAFVGVAMDTPPVNKRVSVPFRVRHAWRGDLRDDRVVNVWLTIDLHLQAGVEEGRSYLVWAPGPQLYPVDDEPISRSNGRALTEEAAADLIEFLDAPEQPPVSRQEMIDLIIEWESGVVSTTDVERWFHVAYVQREANDPFICAIVEGTYLILTRLVARGYADCIDAPATAHDMLQFLERYPDDPNARPGWTLAPHGNKECAESKRMEREAPID